MVNQDKGVSTSPQNSGNPDQESGQFVRNSSSAAVNGESKDSLFSPGFRSVAAMAGWDEEALMVASLVVEDTPDRQPHLKHHKNQRNTFKTPPSTNSRRKRRVQRRSPTSMPVVILNLEEEDTANKVQPPKESEVQKDVAESKKEEKASSEKGTDEQGSEASTSNCSTILCMDRLREELSCAICLEICFEPSTTPCGHSFCKKCLRSAADKCGKKCPKCRQLISNVRHRHVQESRSSRGAELRNDSPTRRNGRQSSRTSLRRRNELPSQDEDAALALRLQREEFMVHRGPSSDQEYTSSLALARANLRAMASRAIRGL
ncbi:OLC1v1011758C1 [Oldenlandia corymbosa var. corymbosa]|uniref:RING-type E3 ubiquitin transferase n=1 Tax=Oldenlandia corymbosa var. corymbosa TaxID=529605 RepID=A0AAV1DUF3_OLDCO|nr:OLC1v1011758C1 [Oldenlandia corymbosa var. corymbosa]